MSTTALLNIGLLFALCIGALIYHPIWATAGYIMVYALYSKYIWWGLELLVLRPSLLISTFLFIAILIHRKEINWSLKSAGNREILLYLFGGWLWVATFTGAGTVQDSWYILEKMTKVFIFIYMFIRTINTLENYNIVIWSIILTGIVLGFQGNFSSEGAFWEGRLERLGGTDFSASNELAIYIAITVVFLGVELIRSSFWKKPPYILALALMLNSIALTKSRGVIVAFLGAFPYAIFRIPTKNKKAAFVMILLGVVLFWRLTDPTFFMRIKTMTEIAKTSDERVNIWKASIPMFLDHPLGVGVGNFQGCIGNYLGDNVRVDAHNSFVLCYSELGFIGIALYALILISVFIQIKRIKKLTRNTSIEYQIIPYCYGLILSNLICIFGYLTHSGLYMEYVWWILAMPICLENVAKKVVRESDQ